MSNHHRVKELHDIEYTVLQNNREYARRYIEKAKDHLLAQSVITNYHLHFNHKVIEAAWNLKKLTAYARSGIFADLHDVKQSPGLFDMYLADIKQIARGVNCESINQDTKLSILDEQGTLNVKKRLTNLIQKMIRDCVVIG